MHTVCIDNIPKQLCPELYTYNLFNGENEVGPDSRHVPYFIIHCQCLKINVDFQEKSVRWSQTPSPLANSVRFHKC